MEFQKVNIQPIEAQWLHNGQLTLDVLRLDELHPIISGNKWFKLQYYLHEALELQKQTVATFGGAWSNHIIATAFACKEAGLRSLGIIRGEEPKQLSPTLQYAMDYGMKLHFVSRERYRNKQAVKAGISDTDHYWIDEGGFGLTGAKGASEILQLVNSSTYSHIICAVGTGTMLAGLLIAANEGQQLIGISSMKGNL
ncbi:MAG TPA: pyridoxal-phosphate dependent enzyme, partial [Segetibacter sp.]